jgi:hypothetical protein
MMALSKSDKLEAFYRQMSQLLQATIEFQLQKELQNMQQS